MSHFTAVEMAPRDPILGLNEQFQSDTNPAKVNLGVGVYTDENGKIPLLACVKAAESQLLEAARTRSYLPIDGLAAYDKAVQTLVFGEQSPLLSAGRVATIQALGGTGGLKVGADFLKKIQPQAKVLISDPSWENHRALFTNAGFTVENYAYYDAKTKGINFDGMLADLEKAAAGTIIVLHACCHNPTGYDLNASQWAKVVATIKSRNLIAFLDMAYQGFGDGLAEDREVVDRFAEAGVNFLVSTSFSKSFSLYGERVGGLSVVATNKEETARVLSQLKIVIRTNYSNPPTHGAQIVATVLSNPALRAQWEQELAGMRNRIKKMRAALVERLQAAGATGDLSYITAQRGMFSYSGLSKSQMERLRGEFGVYGVDSGRICVAALNDKNLDYVAASIAKVL